MCDNLDTQHIGCHAVKKLEGKLVQDKLPQIGINRMTDLGMLEQQVRRTPNLGSEAPTQTGNP
ncbi:hypothetical protein D3C83_84300 [compost metagenome]